MLARRRTAPLSQIRPPVTPFSNGLVFCGAPSVDVMRLLDLSAYGNHGAASATKPGRALGPGGYGSTHAKASAQYFSVGTSDALNPRTAITLLLYLRMTANSTSSLFTRDAAGQRAYTLQYNGTRYQFYLNGGAAGANVGLLTSNAAASLTDPTMLIATFDDARDTAALWINGRIDISSTGFTETMPTSTADTRVGARAYSGFEDYADAEIYLACMWNRALTDGQCMRLSANPWQIFGSRRNYLGGAAGAAVGNPWNYYAQMRRAA